MTLIGLLCATFGFALLGLATHEHHQRRFGRHVTARRRRRLRGAAWAAIAASLPLAVQAHGWVYGPVWWLGMLMLAAGMVFLWLNLVPAGRTAGRRSGRVREG